MADTSKGNPRAALDLRPQAQTGESKGKIKRPQANRRDDGRQGPIARFRKGNAQLDEALMA